MTEGIDLISKHHELAGFYHGNSLVQTVKELVDNCVDASRHHCSALNIQACIAVRLEEDPVSHLLSITVTDNGCGMEDPVSCLSQFQSSSPSEDDHRIGKYGLGLTAASMFAQRFTEHSTIIKTKTVLEKSPRNFMVVFDKKESRMVVEMFDAFPKDDEFLISGTSVNIKHKMNLTTLAEMEVIHEYVAKIVLVSDFPLTIVLRQKIALDRAPIREYCNPRSNSARDLQDHIFQVIGKWLDCCLPKYRCQDISLAIINKNKCLFEVWTLALLDITDDFPISDSGRHLELSLPVEVWKFVNGKPLPFHPVCDIFKAVEAVKLRTSHVKLVSRGEGFPLQLRARRENQFWSTSVEELLQRCRIIVLVKLSASNVAFADLSKSAVVSLSIEESLELTRVAQVALQKLLEGPLLSKIFVDPKTYKVGIQKLYASKVAIRSISISVFTLLHCCQDEELRKKWLSRLQSNQSSALTTLNALIEDYLLSEPKTLSTGDAR